MPMMERYGRLLERIVAELRAHYGTRLVACAVYGSVGRGTQRDGSDVDLLLVVRDLPRGRFARVEEFLPVEDRLENPPCLARRIHGATRSVREPLGVIGMSVGQEDRLGPQPSDAAALRRAAARARSCPRDRRPAAGFFC